MTAQLKQNAATGAPASIWKPYPAYKDSGVEWIGEIPEGWDFFKILWAYLEIGSGNTPTSSDPSYYDDNGYPWVITGDLNDGILQETTKRITQKAIIDNPSLKKYKKGALILAMYGATIGKLSLLDIEAYTNQACCILGHSKFLTNRFSFYWLIGLREHIINLSAGGGQPNISQKIIKQICINVPSLPEQRAIADFLDRETARINGIVAMQTRMIELLKEKRSALITQAVTKGLDPKAKMKPSGMEWIGEIPEGWEVRKVKFTAPSNKVKLKNSDYKIALENIESFTGRYLESDVPFEGEGIAFDNSSILYGKLRPYLCKVYMPEKEGLCVSEFLVMIPNEALSCKQFLFHYFLSYLFTDVINGATFGSKMPRADWKIVGNFKLFLPPLPVQHTIADFLDCETIKVDKMVGKIEKQIELLNEYKQSLITHAVTGKIDVRDEINAQNS